MQMHKHIKFYFFFFIFLFLTEYTKASTSEEFTIWLKDFKTEAIQKGISEQTVSLVFKNARYLEKVIKYDRRQPEFIELTEIYVNKRATQNRAQKAKALYLQNKKLFDEIEKKFFVEKELLLAFWGIETNFGKHVGKMDIVSSLATLSFDKRRSAFFSKQLLILLSLVDKKIIEVDTLFGSWAGAIGNFQFMPSTIKSYAIDYDKDGKIDLKKSTKDSVASAANYIHRMGWKQDTHCYIEVQLNKEIKDKLVNYSARGISNKLTIKKWKKLGVELPAEIEVNKKTKAALISPDGKTSPKFLVFDNYEKVLQWNRSLRFGISVCKLANMIKNDI